MARLGHTACWRGKRVKIKLKDGTTFIDRFVERKTPYIFLENYGKLHVGDLKNFLIYKGNG